MQWSLFLCSDLLVLLNRCHIPSYIGATCICEWRKYYLQTHTVQSLGEFIKVTNTTLEFHLRRQLIMFFLKFSYWFFLSINGGSNQGNFKMYFFWFNTVYITDIKEKTSLSSDSNQETISLPWGLINKLFISDNTFSSSGVYLKYFLYISRYIHAVLMSSDQYWS